jgi:purine-binding chemotaxis protein CheW
MNLQHKRFDWERVAGRMQQQQSDGDAAIEARERMETVYRERAARLAVPRALPTTSIIFRALVFALGTEQYAVELQDLAEVLPFSGCTPVPRMPQELRGVINLRGTIRPVVDLARVLGLVKAEGSASGWLLLLRRGAKEVGILVDQVQTVRSFRSDETIDPTQAGARSATGYLKAITADNVMLISAERLLSLSFIKEGLL